LAGDVALLMQALVDQGSPEGEPHGEQADYRERPRDDRLERDLACGGRPDRQSYQAEHRAAGEGGEHGGGHDRGTGDPDRPPAAVANDEVTGQRQRRGKQEAEVDRFLDRAGGARDVALEEGDKRPGRPDRGREGEDADHDPRLPRVPNQLHQQEEEDDEQGVAKRLADAAGRVDREQPRHGKTAPSARSISPALAPTAIRSTPAPISPSASTGE